MEHNYWNSYSASPGIATMTQKNHVKTNLNFFKPNEDGSPPAPAYMANPKSFERPQESHTVTVRDVSGDEDKYTLDSHGFQFVNHVSEEKDFVDEEQVNNVYYEEIDQLLKRV